MLNGYSVSVLQDGIISVDWNTVRMDLIPLNFTLKNKQNGKFYVKHIIPQFQKTI